MMTALLAVERKARRRFFKSLWRALEINNWNDFVYFVKFGSLCALGMSMMYVVFVLGWIMTR